MSANSSPEVTSSVELQALARACKALSGIGDRKDRVECFARELHSVVTFDYLFISNLKEEAGEAKWILEVNGRSLDPADVAIPLEESTGRWAHEKQQVLTIAD